MARIPRPLAALLAAGAIALAVPAQGAAATPLERRVAAMAKQIKTLQRQVKTLQTQVRTLAGVAGAHFAGHTCDVAITADLLQSTWTTVDRLAADVGRPAYFGAQQPVNDFGNCGLLQQPTVTRPGIVSPPSIAAFNPLLTWLHIEQ